MAIYACKSVLNASSVAYGRRLFAGRSRDGHCRRQGGYATRGPIKTAIEIVVDVLALASAIALDMTEVIARMQQAPERGAAHGTLMPEQLQRSAPVMGQVH
jgi:hypothetical protein